jgi:hypothetical protein
MVRVSSEQRQRAEVPTTTLFVTPRRCFTPHSRHPEVRAQRASKDDGPGASAVVLRGPLRGHLRMTGNRHKRSHSRDAHRTRVIVKGSDQAANVSLSAPIFARECRRWGRYSHDPCFKPRSRRKETRKRNADERGPYPPQPAGRGARSLSTARSPIGVPPAALCQWDYSSQGSTWARLRDTRGQTRRESRQPVWHIQRCTSHAGHNAGRLMPRPPGSSGDEPPRAGTASHSHQPE